MFEFLKAFAVSFLIVIVSVRLYRRARYGRMYVIIDRRTDETYLLRFPTRRAAARYVAEHFIQYRIACYDAKRGIIEIE